MVTLLYFTLLTFECSYYLVIKQYYIQAPGELSVKAAPLLPGNRKSFNKWEANMHMCSLNYLPVTSYLLTVHCEHSIQIPLHVFVIPDLFIHFLVLKGFEHTHRK